MKKPKERALQVTPKAPAKRLRNITLTLASLVVIAAVVWALFHTPLKEMLERWHLRRCNVILITLDTLRTDHVSCYNSHFAATPSLDALAADGVLFEQCIAQTPLTLPSHTTILSGTYPYYHRVRTNKSARVPVELPLLAEIFRTHGVATSAFVGAVVLHSTFGLNRGFDVYDDQFNARHNSFFNWDEIRRPAAAVLHPARAWIEKQHRQRFFSWIHLYDPHAPWDPPAEYRQRYPNHLYSAAIASMDAELGTFFNFLKSSGLWSNTIIVIVADHGEGLGEHLEQTHGFFIYESTVHVPLLVHLPIPLRVKHVSPHVELVDIAPTILEAVGFERPAGMQGHSLLNLILDKPSSHPDTAYSETYYPQIHFGWSPLTAFYEGARKYIRAPRPELYDLTLDPGETHNLAATQPADARRLDMQINRLMAMAPKGAFNPEKVNLSAAMRSKLASLGYISAVVNPASQDNHTDPKDKINIINQLLIAKEQAEKGNWTEAGKTARSILKDNPQINQARITSADSYRAAGDYASAIQELQLGLKYNDNDNQTLSLLGHTLTLVGRHREAAVVFESCAAINPENPANFNNLGLAYWNSGELAKAEAAYKQALQRDNTYALTHTNLGLLYLLGLGDTRRARESLLTAIALDPKLPAAQDAMGGYYARTGAFDKAREHWLRCLELEPKNYDACYNLFMLCAKKMPDRQMALVFYERLHRDFYANLPEAERRAIEAIRQSL